MTPVCPATCTAAVKLGTVAELFCFLPEGHEEQAHWDVVDGIWWMTEEQHDAANPA